VDLRDDQHPICDNILVRAEACPESQGVVTPTLTRDGRGLGVVFEPGLKYSVIIKLGEDKFNEGAPLLR
jgi:hypothetical protein